MKKILQKIIDEMFIERALTKEERNCQHKDYWEGYTRAKTEVYLIIKKYL